MRRRIGSGLSVQARQWLADKKSLEEQLRDLRKENEEFVTERMKETEFGHSATDTASARYSMLEGRITMLRQEKQRLQQRVSDLLDENAKQLRAHGAERFEKDRRI